MKDFDGWNKIKKDSENSIIRYCNPRELWWLKLGCNLGHEQDGKGKYFERPVLIIRKFNKRIFLAVPLTTKNKNNPFHIKVRDNHGTMQYVIISQLRLLDVSRLIEKMGYVGKVDFEKIKKAIREII